LFTSCQFVMLLSIFYEQFMMMMMMILVATSGE